MNILSVKQGINLNKYQNTHVNISLLNDRSKLLSHSPAQNSHLVHVVYPMFCLLALNDYFCCRFNVFIRSRRKKRFALQLVLLANACEKITITFYEQKPLQSVTRTNNFNNFLYLIKKFTVILTFNKFCVNSL